MASKENSPAKSPQSTAQSSSQLTIEDVTKLIQAFRNESSTPKDSKKAEVQDYLRPTFAPVGEMAMWKHPPTANRYRYAAVHEILESQLNFQRDFLPPNPADASPESMKAWNAGIAKMRDDLEKCMAAENSKYGWGLFDTSKRMRLSNPELQKNAEDATKLLRERDLYEEKRSHTPAGRAREPFSAWGTGGNACPHGAAYGSNRGGYSSANGPRQQSNAGYQDYSKGGGRPGLENTQCYECRGYGHYARDCPDNRRQW